MNIGVLSRQTGVSTKTVRYYETIGLVPPPERVDNGYRIYQPDAVERLLFIRDAQASGLSLTEIGAILELRDQGESTCDHVVHLLERHLQDLDQHIKSLKKTRTQLAAFTDRARSLDPAACSDPNRCQTIARMEDAGATRHVPSIHIHQLTRAGHSHPET